MTPLVSVGVPTFNRAELLERAIRSVLAHESVELELIVSDNASTDATEQVCRGIAEADPRLRYLRQARNVGPFANFRATLDAARGDYFMWLADDDWLDAGYLDRAVTKLQDDPSLALVCGRIRFFEGDRLALTEPPVNARSSTAGTRVLEFYAKLTRAGSFYGLSPTAVRRQVPVSDVFGFDWDVVAGHAALGGLGTAGELALNRTLGPSEDPVASAIAFGVTPGFRARYQHLWIAGRTFRMIADGRPPFARIGGRLSRTCVGAAAAAMIVARFVVYARAVALATSLSARSNRSPSSRQS